MTDSNDTLEIPKPMVPVGVDDNEFSLVDLYDPRSKYSPEDKMAIVAAYVATGDSIRAADLCRKKLGLKVPNATIRWWKMEAAWWSGAVARVQREQDEKMDAKISEIMEYGIESISKTLIEGEEVLTNKGDVVKKKASLRDQTIAIATLYDKREKMRMAPIVAKESKTKSEVLEKLAESFERLSEEICRKDPKIVSEQ